MMELTYLSRWAAARLVAWWVNRPRERKWRIEADLAVGLVLHELAGRPPLQSKKLTESCLAMRVRLRDEMLGPDAGDLVTLTGDDGE